MTSLEQINRYLRDLQIRMRVLAATRGAAIAGATALLATLLLVWIANRYQFAEGVVVPVRIVLFAAVSAALFLALFIPLRKVDKRWTTRLAERGIHGLDQRLLTVSEADASNSFTELLAEETLGILRNQPPQDFGFGRWLPLFAVAAVVSVGVLIWMIAAGPGYWGYGASLLWMGKASAGAPPLYAIVVQPGNKNVRRHSDQLITAQLLNFSAPQVTLYAKYHGSSQWQQTPMQAEPAGNGYQFSFVGLANGVEYYVQAGRSHSKHYTLGVRDLPAVKQVRTVIHFPDALGLRDVSNDSSGDVRAVKGSTAEVWVLTDRPLQHGELLLNDRSKIALAPQNGNWSKAILPVKKDGSYHVAAIDSGDNIRISDDYFIEAKKDEPPVVKIVNPGRDPHVSPIEEVPVTVEASDDYGLKTLDLHYSVNGGPEQTVALSKTSGHEAKGKTTLYFENFKLVPGDLVSFYATARDANSTARTDIVFAQAEPFDYHFSQSQQAGGGGGMGAGGDNDRISERQKDIIAATWNQLKNGPGEKSAVAENAHFLSQLEGKLGEQADTLAKRMGSRELEAESPEFKGFSDAMTQASQEMQRSVGVLKNAKWQDALAPEQKALQSLLRAEAMFRNIQVAYGARGSQGMGGGGAERDLSRMLDLEMDKNKNQYETGNSASQSSDEQQQKSLDEAMQRLKMLAERQQQLAQQRQPDQLSQQRWEEEQLRREAEQLRQQIQQLSQNANNSSSQQSGQPSSSSGAQGQNSSQAQSSASDSVRQAADALKRAEDEMRQAVSSHDASAQQRAAQQLAEAAELLKNHAQAQAGSSVAEMARRGQEIARQQREINEQARRMYGGLDTPDNSAGETGDGSMPEMNDPRYGRRSWYWRQLEMQPRRPATAQERSLANSKEKLGKELESLQQQMQEQAQTLQDGQPGVSSKLRKALSDAEGEELALRMQKSAEWMREGFGSRTYSLENSVTKGVEQLSRDLRAAQDAAAQSGANGNAEDQKTLQALAQVRKLRQQLDERMQASRNSAQNGSNQSAANQSPSAQAGNQAGQNAQPTDTTNGTGRYGPAIPYSSIHEAENALSGLQQGLTPRDRDLSRQLTGAVGALRHLDESRAGEMEARLRQDLLPNLERLEAELSRRLEDTAGAQRMNRNEPAPEQYRDAVAKYFRTLSQ